MAYQFDLVVLGTGPAGESAALNAAKHGLKVAVVEREKVGGGCTHVGTIPSKALRQAVKQTVVFNTNSIFRAIGEPKVFSYPDVLRHAQKVVDQQMEVRADFYGRNGVQLYYGVASFKDKHALAIDDGNTVETITAERIVIATGSHPYRPPEIDFNHPRVYCSDKILEMPCTPRTMIIYGAGVIGCEYACILAGLGVKVDLINNRDRLLSFLDDEISDMLGYQLRKSGVRLRHNEEFESLDTEVPGGVALKLKSGKTIRANGMVWCNGRTGNTEQLNLDAVGLTADGRGQLKVNDFYQTEVDNIYAAGDVVGWPSLASASYDQGRAASFDLMGKTSYWEASDVPTGIYTIPEISSLGKTERELTEACIPYEVGQAQFKDIARAQITDESVGMLKILFHSETLEILGIHCFGDQSVEIIHIGQAIMNQEGEANSIKYFTGHTFNYPTMAEAYRVAALDGLNRIHYKVPGKGEGGDNVVNIKAAGEE